MQCDLTLNRSIYFLRTLICSLPAYSLGKEEEWYALPPPARGGSLALPLSLPGFISTIIAGITIDSHSDAEEQGRFGFGFCFRGKWCLLCCPVIRKSPISRCLYAFVIVVRSKFSGRTVFPLQCSWDTITAARKFNCGGLAHTGRHMGGQGR